jgi:hypothetical protein
MSRYYRSFLEESGVAYTARTTAFAIATAITDTTILNALNTFDLGLISNGLDTKMKAVYPFIGGTSTTHKYNFFDPRDLDVAFRLQFNGGWTHSSNGLQGNGVNTYADTFFKPFNNFTDGNKGGLNVYSRTNSSLVTVDFGATGDGTGGNFTLTSNRGANDLTFQTGNIPFASGTITNTLGLIVGSCINSSDRRVYKNGVKLGTETTNNPLVGTTRTLYVGALNYSSLFSTVRQYALASVTEGLTDADQTTLYTLVQAFETSLSRQV